METAAMLGLPSARWATEIYLRERDRGILANKTHAERHSMHPDEMLRKERDAFYWQVTVKPQVIRAWTLSEECANNNGGVSACDSCTVALESVGPQQASSLPAIVHFARSPLGESPLQTFAYASTE